MTVRTQLETEHGTHRLFYLAVDGVEPYLVQPSDKGTPSGWSRSCLVCLDPSYETTMGLDLGKMKSQLSQVTFKLIDVDDPTATNGSRYFGKLFSTGRYNITGHARMLEASNYHVYVDANATTIPIASNASISSPANGYIGQESISWTADNAAAIINATRGLYSAIDVSNPWGQTYLRPQKDGSSYTYSVSTVPFSFVGRRVALYVTTWDPATEAYRTESESELLWVGRVSDQISQDGRTGVWSLSCKSIMQEVDTSIPKVQPEAYLEGINLMGDKGRTFWIDVYDGNGDKVSGQLYGGHSITGTVPKGVYSPSTLCKAVLDALPSTFRQYFNLFLPEENPLIYNSTAGDAEIYVTSIKGYDSGRAVFWASHDCHVWAALGFGFTPFEIECNTKVAGGAIGKKSAQYYKSYHPLHTEYNGYRLYVSESFPFWEDQGDDDDPAYKQACVFIEETTQPDPNKSKKGLKRKTIDGNYYARYNDRKMEEVQGNDPNRFYLELENDVGMPLASDAFVGAKAADDLVVVKQLYLPKYYQKDGTKKGPFELLLTPLLSTGTKNYNGTYDRAPLDLAMGIQEELVDTASFLAADKAIMANFLAHRKLYPIAEPESWLDMIAKEGQLFGYALVWRKGKLRVRPVLDPDTETWTVQLTDNNMCSDIYEFPKVTQSTKVMVNRYRLKIAYDATQDKWGGDYVITDADSVTGTTVVKEVTIQHTGLDLSSSTATNIKTILKDLLLGRFIRYPLPMIDRSLAPTLMNKVFVGDLVKLTSSRIQDPFGTGTRTTSCYAVVTDCKWDYKKATGTCRLMLLDWPAAAAWAPAALVDITAANGGFDTVSNSLILANHTWTEAARLHDGNAVAELAGWNVLVIERAPVDPTSPVVHGPFKVAAYTAANSALALNDAVNSWTNTIEHFVTFADFPAINTEQYTQDKGTWQADINSELLNQSNRAQRYR